MNQNQNQVYWPRVLTHTGNLVPAVCDSQTYRHNIILHRTGQYRLWLKTGGSKWLNLHHQQKAEEGGTWKNQNYFFMTPAVSCLKICCCVRSVWMCSLIKSPLHVDTTSRSTEKEKADIVDVFTALIRSIERSQAELLEMMEEKQKAAERQAEGLIKELEQEISVLKRRDTELEQLSHTEEHLHVLQIYSSMCSPPHTKNWTEISINTDVSVDTVRTALSRLQQTLNEKLNKSLNDKLKETELKRIQQYAVDVTLDPDTAHPDLILSADGKQVRDGDRRQNLPDTPQRFSPCISVLGKHSFSSGRFYYEVQVRGKTGWSLGVARENINRKGKITLSPQNGFWAVTLWNENQYDACEHPSVLLTLKEKVEVVGVFVDYEEGLVSFYDVKSRSNIYSFTGQTFTEELYPFFSPCFNEGDKNAAPLIISPVFKTEYI
ncbi:zinc finger protein RFP-like isoform X2 [Tachysurus fulvidraco]|uniref:zinc finger protein RFP-like isoform X2 n=1 Tax=Tachysurus fulvidraco TaxID=1234273 RepID=UPI001FED722A|nr:zinc finger protein RFP-like isoform X2 [Tachysurus fulvidraco]